MTVGHAARHRRCRPRPERGCPHRADDAPRICLFDDDRQGTGQDRARVAAWTAAGRRGHRGGARGVDRARGAAQHDPAPTTAPASPRARAVPGTRCLLLRSGRQRLGDPGAAERLRGPNSPRAPDRPGSVVCQAGSASSASADTRDADLARITRIARATYSVRPAGMSLPRRPRRTMTDHWYVIASPTDGRCSRAPISSRSPAYANGSIWTLRNTKNRRLDPQLREMIAPA